MGKHHGIPSASRASNPNAVLQYITRRRNYGGATGGGGGGGGTGGGTLPTFVNLAQAARAAGSKFLLTYNQAYPAQNSAFVAGSVNTILGLPGLKTNYSNNLAELLDVNGVAAFSAAATGKTANIPAVAACSTQIWKKGRTRIDEIKALAASAGAFLASVDSDGAGTNKKFEMYWQMAASGLGADLAAAIYSPGAVRTVVAATPTILFTAWPPAGCFVNWAVGYDATLGTLTIEFRDDGGNLLTDSGLRVSTTTLSCFPVFTGSLVTSTLTNLGATTIVLKATTLVGTITNQATFTIGGVVYTATAAATAAANAITVPVAATGVSIPALTAAAFTSGPLLNVDGGANGVVSVNHAFNGGATAAALRHAGLAVYSGAMPTSSPPAGTVNRWQPGQPGDANQLGLWFMGDKTSGALTSLAPAVQGGVPITITGTAAGAFDNGAKNGWPLFPTGPGGICIDENQWSEAHMVTGVTSPTAMTFNYGPDPTVILARAQGTPSRAYMFEGENGVNALYGGFGTSAANCTSLIQAYVTGVVSRYVATFGTADQGGIREWNVANEFLQGGTLQPSTWSANLPNWVVVACQAVHAADPSAMIMLNLDNIELSGNSAQKSAYLTTINALITAGIPANKIIAGYEFHLKNAPAYNAADAAAFKTHVAALPAGVWWCASECDITDVAFPGTYATQRAARQALNVSIWQTFFAGVLTNDPTSWASVYSFGGWQLSALTSWINANLLGSSIQILTGTLATSGVTNNGATSIVIAATSLTGKVVQGQQFTIGAVTYTVGAAGATASANSMTVPVSPAVSGSIAGGTAVTLGSMIERWDGDLEYCDLLDENYARMGGVGSTQDVYGAWMTMFATHAGAVPQPPANNTPNMPVGLRIVFNSGAMTPASVVFPVSPVRGSSLQFNGPVPGTMTYLSPGQGVDDDPSHLLFAQNDSTDAGPYGLRVKFPIGLVSDPALCLELPLSPQGTRKLYMAYDGRLPPTFSLAGFAANAMKFSNPKDNGGNDNIGMAFLGFLSGSGYYPGAGIQGPVTVNIPNNNAGQFGAKFFQPGDIPRFEHLWVSDNPLGGGNGQYTIWQDNVLASTKTLELEGVGAALGFRDMVFYISRAVTGGNPTVLQWFDFNNVVIALDG